MRFNNKRISMHHIGGRSGSKVFPVLKKFEKDIINVFYDADSDCLAEIQERNQNLESELHVLPYCLADACKSTSFNINYNSFTSSLYDPNPDYNSYYVSIGDRDELWSEATKVMEKRHIEVVTIDHIFQSTTAPMPPPDFLSIDTQGSEYEILLGAKETLKSSVVALVIEAEFHPIYKGQKLFGDLAKLLSNQGFDFVRFLSLCEMYPFRAPIGLRGEGFHMFSDALFFRRIDNIDNNNDQFRRYVMLRKLAFIAIVFNQFEYGLSCLRRSKDLVSHHSTMQEEEPVYLRFLRNLEQATERMPIVYPNTSFAASKAPCESSATSRTGMINKTGATDKIKQLLRQIPVLYLLLKWIKRVLDKLFSKVTFSVKYRFAGYTDVEAILIKYGLKTQANVLRKNRVVREYCQIITAGNLN